ncbi:hypothetical protein SDC9_93754 [bioreactor metagenome]|uniref:Uncharacterized protein n=1 Tax=bioreactor metagenome TaxID=1076179 RepID=A0A645A2A9_9ZZZZ
MGRIGVSELRNLQKLTGPHSLDLLSPRLVQYVRGIGHGLAQQQKYLRRDLVGHVKEPFAHLVGGTVGEMGVQQVHKRGYLVRVQLQLGLDQLTLHPVVTHHHHNDKTLVVHRKKIKVPGKKLFSPGGGGVYGIAFQRADRFPRLGHHPVQLLHFQMERGVQLFRLRHTELLAFHQLVDIHPISLRRGHPAGGGVGLLQISLFHQIRQFVSDRGGADRAPHLGGNGLGANRFGGKYIILHHRLQYLLFSVC